MTGWFQVSTLKKTSLSSSKITPKQAPELVIFATPLKGINLDIVGWD
jgi:hypothetical protein